MSAPPMSPRQREMWAVWLESAGQTEVGIGDNLPAYAEGCRKIAAATEAFIESLPHGHPKARRLRETLRRIVEHNRRQEKVYRKLHGDLQEALRLADELGLGDSR